MKGIFHQNKTQLLLEVVLFLVAFSIPISFAFNSIVMAVLFLFSFVFFNRKEFIKSITKKEVYVYYLLFFLIQVLSLLYTTEFDRALQKVQQNSVFLILPIAFINLKDQIDTRKYKAAYFGLLAIVFSTLLLSLLNLFYKALTFDVAFSEFFREKFVEAGLLYLIHVPYLSMLIVFLIIATVKFSFLTKKQLDLTIKTVAILILITALFFLSGMMSLVILMLFLSVYFLTTKLSNRIKISVTLVVIVVSGFTFNSIKNYKKIDRIRGSEHAMYRIQKLLNSKDTVRNVNWKSVAKVISVNPLLGVSADGGMELLQKERPILSEPYINRHNAHNDILEILLRYGILGLLIYLLLMFKLFKNAWQKKSAVFKWFLIVFVLSGITESYLQRQIGLTFFVFFSLLLYSYNLKTEK